MHLDVRDLRNFYYRSALGRAAQKIIRDEVRATWPDTHGMPLENHVWNELVVFAVKKSSQRRCSRAGIRFCGPFCRTAAA